MEQIWIYCCEDSIDGIFTAVYDAWDSRHGHANIRIEINGQNEECNNYILFAQYIDVVTDSEKAEKVAKSIRQKISPRAYEMIARAALCNQSNKGNEIYKFLVKGFAAGSKITDYLSDESVSAIFQMNRNVGNEVHFYLGFLRFEELSNQVMLAKFEPKNDITGILAPHFKDRFPNANLLIADMNRNHAAICMDRNPWILMKLSDEEMQSLNIISSEEGMVKSLWKTFFKNLTIEERENYKCQRNHLPLHYRKYMTEFSEGN